jgi:hypothetical protein
MGSGLERFSGVERAALAFTILSTEQADLLAARLTLKERHRLRDGIVRVKDASQLHRTDAVFALVAAAERGMEWPEPANHDGKGCPFKPLHDVPSDVLAAVLERRVIRNPLEVAVTLCHLKPAERDGAWALLSADAQGAVLSELRAVPTINGPKTRLFAREVLSYLSHAARRERYRPGASQV